jgi:hypothetical protein
MGRGLSDLQRFIVAKAATCERLYYAEILAEFFGWKPKELLRYEPLHGITYKMPVAGKYAHGQHFSADKIGEARYRKTVATLSRACSRLAARGLVECLQGACSRWSAVEITDKGREWLSVNRVADLPQC